MTRRQLAALLCVMGTSLWAGAWYGVSQPHERYVVVETQPLRERLPERLREDLPQEFGFLHRTIHAQLHPLMVSGGAVTLIAGAWIWGGTPIPDRSSFVTRGRVALLSLLCVVPQWVAAWDCTRHQRWDFVTTLEGRLMCGGPNGWVLAQNQLTVGGIVALLASFLLARRIGPASPPDRPAARTQRTFRESSVSPQRIG